MLAAYFLGRFDIRIDGSSIEISSRKAQSLLAYLILNLDVQHRREKLAGILWPELDEVAARDKLRYTLWQLRKAIGDQYLLADKISLSFNPEAEYWFDGEILEGMPGSEQTIEDLLQVVSLYEGELLPGFYEDWVSLERERLQAIFEGRVRLLLNRLAGEERWREAIEWGEKWISLGQTPETSFQVIMVAHSQLGDSSSAVRAYQRCVDALDEQLGVEPSKETTEIYQHILGGGKPDISFLGEAFQPRTTIVNGEDGSRFSKDMFQDLPQIEESVFVARERELELLSEKLQLMLAGNGQLVFVVGDAGQGKTTLLNEFCRRAQREYADLVVAIGECEAHTGIGDPHLPFRDILALLTGDFESRWSSGAITRDNAERLWHLLPITVAALTEKGPDLIGSFVSADEVWARASASTVQSDEWLAKLKMQVDLRYSRSMPMHIDHGNIQKDLFDQYTRVVLSIADQQPLILVIDDLQWADLGSISMLFHLCRRIEGQRIMILCAFRSDDISLRRGGEEHPLSDVLSELKRIFGEIEINLDDTSAEEGALFIEAFLDTEPNRLGKKFRQALKQHTAGQPLFTIELLRQMQAQGDLLKDGDGYWIEGPHLGWDMLPAKVEAVIERRINRLPEALRDILNTASIEGREFTAEVIAAVRDVPVSTIISQLSRELDRRYQLVEVSGVQYAGQQRLSRYQFRHNLFHKFVYESMDHIELVGLHEKTGLALERIFQGKTGQIAGNLARHFGEAGIVDKAVDYLLQAGDTARRTSANAEAIAYYKGGIDMLADIPDESLRNEKELALQTSLGPPLVATKGYTSPEVEQTYERARELSELTGNMQGLAPILWGLCAFYQVRGKNLLAYDLAQQIQSLAEVDDDNKLRLLSHWMLGLTLTHLGKFPLARENLELAIELYDLDNQESMTYLYGQNPKVTCLVYLALNLWILGYADQAEERCTQAITLSEQVAHPFSRSFACSMAALYYALKKDPLRALDNSEQAITIAKEESFPFLLSFGLIIRGWSRSYSGKTSMAVKLIRNGIEVMEQIGAELGRPFFLSLLAEGYRNAKQYDQGLKTIESALQTAKVNSEHWYDAALFHLKAELLEIQDGAGPEIRSTFQQAVDVARMQGAKSLELLGLMGLTKLFQKQGQPGKGQEELAGIFEWFTEGFDTESLKQARILLGENK